MTEQQSENKAQWQQAQWLLVCATKPRGHVRGATRSSASKACLVRFGVAPHAEGLRRAVAGTCGRGQRLNAVALGVLRSTGAVARGRKSMCLGWVMGQVVVVLSLPQRGSQPWLDSECRLASESSQLFSKPFSKHLWACRGGS